MSKDYKPTDRFVLRDPDEMKVLDRETGQFIPLSQMAEKRRQRRSVDEPRSDSQ